MTYYGEKTVETATNQGNADISSLMGNDLRGSNQNPFALDYINTNNSNIYPNNIYSLSSGSPSSSSQFSIPFLDLDGTKEGANELGDLSNRKDTVRDSLGENVDEPDGIWQGDRNDYFRFSVTNRTNADIYLQASTPDIEFEILDSEGNFIARSQPKTEEKSADYLVRILTTGDYYLRVYTTIPLFKNEYSLTINNVNLSANIRPESSDVNLFRYDNDGRTDSNENRGNGGNFTGIEANKETVIVIHGWRNSDESATIQDLLTQVTKSNVQVLALDWSSIAQANIDQGFAPIETAKWIAPVARWLQGQLAQIGIQANQLTIIGHSLGSFLGAEVGSLYGKAKNLVALDPAAYPSYGNERKTYDIDGQNGGVQTPKDFHDAANKSIAFVIADGLNNGTFGLLGDNEKAATADDSFVIKLDPGEKETVTDIEAHGAVVYTFSNILNRNLLDIGDLNLPKYERDWYDNWGRKKGNSFSSGEATKHEGVLTVKWTGGDTDEDKNLWQVKKLVTVVDGSGKETEIWT